METLADVDVILFCLPADQKVGPGDRFIAAKLTGVRAPVVAVATKSDLVSRHRMAEHLLDIQTLGDWAHIVPLSAVSGDQLDLLTSLVIDELPEGPMLYPEGELTDEPDDVLIAEFVREAALEGVRRNCRTPSRRSSTDRPREGRTDGLLDVRVRVRRATLPEAIIIGKGGSRLRSVGAAARKQIQELLGVPSTWICTSRSRRTGRRTRSSCSVSGSDMGVRPADRRRLIRTWPLILATLALTVLVGLIGSIAGPKWNPTPVSSVPQVDSADVAITPAGADVPAEGTYEVQRTKLRIDLGEWR